MMPTTYRLVSRGSAIPPLDAVIRGSMRLGAAPENEVCVACDGVARQHARIVATDTGCAIEAVDSQPMYVNGERVDRARLRHLDVVTLAPHVDLVFLARAEDAKPMPPEAGEGTVLGAVRAPAPSLFEVPASRLENRTPADSTVLAPARASAPAVVQSAAAGIVSLRLSGNRGQSQTLTLGRSTVGRGMDARVRIDKPYISRLHAIFVVTPVEVVIEDQGSENGTQVNGKRIVGRRVLASGDRVTFADEPFQVEIVRAGGAS